MWNSNFIPRVISVLPSYSFDGDDDSPPSPRIWNGIRYRFCVFILINSDAHYEVFNASISTLRRCEICINMWVFLICKSSSSDILNRVVITISRVLFSDLKSGKCSGVVEARLLQFCEARNVKRGGELMWVDMLLVDVNVSSSFHVFRSVLDHSGEFDIVLSVSCF